MTQDECVPIDPDLGDLMIVLLASTLGGLRDRLAIDGFQRAADLIADLVEIIDCYLTEIPMDDPDCSSVEA